ncbi:MAG: TIGR03619 family F420-dependent LLM class oxidoreductase [Deltaproteobacteria bacterium]|nr:TIGR03619 family F420-dependent LLM class oxidoreductase [Deltaproteobacteria bacterium]
MTGNSVQWGLAIENFTPYPQQPEVRKILAYAERAEALGFESLWAWDHILLGSRRPYPLLESLTTFAAIAARTSRIKLGTGILVPSLRNPVVLAKVTATLDQISNGRLILGLAAGWYEREFKACAVPFKERGKIFVQNLQILRKLWTEESVKETIGPHVFEYAAMLPKPVQKPGPPILIGGYVDTVLKRVAKYGDGWLTYFYTAESYARSFARVQGFAREMGRDPAELTSMNQLPILVGKSYEECDRLVKEYVHGWFDIPPWSECTPECSIRGTVQQCVEQLRKHVEAGVKRMCLVPYLYQPEQVEIIAKEIIPQFS